MAMVSNDKYVIIVNIIRWMCMSYIRRR